MTDDTVIFKLSDEMLSVSKDCIKDIKPFEHLGFGSTGDVVKACIDDDCMYVVKLIDTSNEQEYSEIKYDREINMTRVASDLGIGPKYIRETECMANINNKDKIYKFIVLRKLDDTLGNILDNNPTKTILTALSKCMLELAKLCYSYGFVHGDIYYENDKDINYGNIMFTIVNGVPVKAYLIDFTSSEIGIKSDVKKEWCGVFRRLRKNYSKVQQISDDTRDYGCDV